MVFFSRSSDPARERRAPPAEEPPAEHELAPGASITDDPFARARLIRELRGRAPRRAPLAALGGLLSFVRGAS